MVSSILIIDLNVHQGNCIAEIFAGDPNVFAFSMNRANNFPFRKEKFELDIFSPVGIADEQYLDLQKQTLPGLISRKKPNFIFYLAGVDVLASDKLGKMALTIDHAKDGTGLFLSNVLSTKYRYRLVWAAAIRRISRIL